MKLADHISVLLSQMPFLQMKAVMLFTFIMFYVNTLYNCLILFEGYKYNLISTVFSDVTQSKNPIAASEGEIFI